MYVHLGTCVLVFRHPAQTSGC